MRAQLHVSDICYMWVIKHFPHLIDVKSKPVIMMHSWTHNVPQLLIVYETQTLAIHSFTCYVDRRYLLREVDCLSSLWRIKSALKWGLRLVVHLLSLLHAKTDKVSVNWLSRTHDLRVKLISISKLGLVRTQILPRRQQRASMKYNRQKY